MGIKIMPKVGKGGLRQSGPARSGQTVAKMGMIIGAQVKTAMSKTK